jgi:hypothetical protein
MNCGETSCSDGSVPRRHSRTTTGGNVSQQGPFEAQTNDDTMSPCLDTISLLIIFLLAGALSTSDAACPLPG